MFRFIAILIAWGLVSVPATAQGANENAPPLLLRGLRLGAPDAPPMDVLVRDGMIDRMEPATNDAAPPGVLVEDVKGLIAYGGFFDAYDGMKTPPEEKKTEERRRREDEKLSSIDDMSENRSWERSGVHADRDVVDRIKLDAGGDTDLLDAGVTRRLGVLDSGMVSGLGAVLSTGPGPVEQRVLGADAGLHFAFRRSRTGYPSTLMGTMAQLRQLFFDARRHGEWKREYAVNPRGLRRPPFRPRLDRVDQVLRGELTACFWCASANDVRRTLRLAREHAFRPVIAGDWHVADAAAEIASARLPVLLAVSVPKADHEANASLVRLESKKKKASDESKKKKGDEKEKPAGDAAAEKERGTIVLERVLDHMRDAATRKERENIEERLTAPARLAEAGVRFWFCSGMRGKGSDLLPAARLAVKHGLDRSLALSALTGSGANELRLGADGGSLGLGGPAEMILADGDLLSPGSKIAGVVVDGRLRRAKSAGKQKAKGSSDSVKPVLGSWNVSIEFFAEDAEMTLTKSDTGFEGTFKGSRGSYPITEGRVKGKDVTFTVTFDMGGRSMVATVDAKLDGSNLAGNISIPDMDQNVEFKGTKSPGGSR